MTTKFCLQFPPAEIPALAQRFDYPGNETQLHDLRADIAQRGFLTLEELKIVCRWKTARSQSRVAKNTAADVEAITFGLEDFRDEKAQTVGNLLKMPFQG